MFLKRMAVKNVDFKNPRQTRKEEVTIVREGLGLAEYALCEYLKVHSIRRHWQ